MIQKLKDLEKLNLPCLLKNRKIWNSVDVDYHPPRVERVWTQHGDDRIYLHVIHPCEREEALFHGHPWKSAIHLLPIGNGIYEHGLGYKYEYDFDGDQMQDTDMICVQEVMGEMYYEMSSEDGRHYVRPIGEPVYSIMLAGPIEYWSNNVKPDKLMNDLSKERKEEILNIFENLLG